ncbi:MAG TPA: YkvA family protein [Mariniphaga sp.]|nr:YkvA family protein [Mariniphaga sp.]
MMQYIQFKQYFSEVSLWEKIKNYSKIAGTKVIYVVLLLYYILKDKNVNSKTKLSVAAALGYFILPTDAIFDLTPIIGYSDDLGVLLFVLTTVSSNLTPEIKEEAQKKMREWFGEMNNNDLQELEKSII